MLIILVIFLLIFSYDFTKFRRQNQTMIEQNERMIELLEEMKDK
ncbi:hypothetical protein [Rossellomorea aquimaris]|nr:hypothetical protein [Rossellomorea aquimaris]